MRRRSLRAIVGTTVRIRFDTATNSVVLVEPDNRTMKARQVARIPVDDFYDGDGFRFENNL